VPNIASRIEGLATPNTIAVSEATYRLVEGYFTCESLGEHTLRGVSQPLNIYRVLGASGVQNRLDIVSTRGLTPLVSREQEVGLLLERWAQVKDGQGHVVLLTGDAGIGKSRLVQILKDHVAQEPHIRWECRSLPYYQNTTLYPLTDLFQRLLRFQTDHSPEEKLAKLAQELSQYRLPVEETVPLLAPLLSLALPEHHYPPLNLSPQRQRQKTLETIIAILLELAEHQPVLFILEDLHWTDPSTLELLNLVIEQTPTASLLTLLTCRPHFQPAWHHRSYLTEITVNRLSPTQVKQIVTGMTDGKTFPAEVLAQIVEKTDGVPLFIEELTKAILESGQLRAVDGNYELTGSFATFAIPATLQDSLMARLDRLMTGKVIAQLGATIGRRFSYALLQAVAQLNDRTLQEELHRLVEAELLYQRGVPPQATYTFKHALIQEAAYESLLKSTRQLYHQHTAQVLVEQLPDLVETQPELLAQHYTEAGRAEEAVEYWQRAGERSSVRSAYVEAVAHCTKGLEVLKTLPDTPARAQRELNLLLPLAGALQASKSFAALEAGDAYARARELCRHVEDTPQLYETLLGLQGFYLNRGEFQVTRELGEQALSLAQRLHDPVRLIRAHADLGRTLYWLGELVPARAHLEQALTLPGSQPDHALPFSGQDTRMGALAHAAFTLWRLGYPAQALARGHEMLSLAQGLSHAFSLVRALNYAAYLHQLRREARASQERAEAALALLTEQEFGHWVPIVTFLHGWALAAQGQHEAGMAQMHQGLAARQAIGSVGALSEYLTYLAEAYGGIGQAEEGLRLLAEALTWVETAGHRYHAAEVYRVKGELLLQQAVPDAPQAEACFQQALAIARRQQDRSWELRAAMSLARLWQQQGKQAEARELLAPIYGWFTEGFDTADLQDAKTLLEALT
jgi:predicted ATPase